MADKNKEQLLRNNVIDSVKKYYQEVLKQDSTFEPGQRVPTGGRVYDEKELVNLVNSSLDFWLTAGPYASEFESKLAETFGLKHCSLVNSGSSANLLALVALTSPKLGDRRLIPGDEVITVACCFPTTITPIIQTGAIPVFVDIDIPSYNIDITMLEAALSPKTKAVMIAHTLGNPFDINAVKEFCDKHNLWLIEDNCDSLGSQYFFNNELKYCGTVGDISTSSFYPAHHITMGEGGAVCTNNDDLHKIILSFRDWGRDCWCKPGRDNTCNKRFTKQYGRLPLGYDHKYVYSHFGFNLKITDLQAAIGCAQIQKIDAFNKDRQRNWNILSDRLKPLNDTLILPEPLTDSNPSWFGFILSIKNDAGFSRTDLVKHLESKNIQTRMLFAGNIIKHPCFDDIRDKEGTCYRIAGSLKNTDFTVSNTFWIGTFPGLSPAHLNYVADEIISYIKDQNEA
jgi:CDP-6-deoxy-D-xylo-4-hexulose-3-dehydrase